MSDDAGDPKITAFEEALRGLAPAAARLNRDRIFYAAGQRSARRRGWFWPATAAASLLLAGTLGAALALQPREGRVERVVVYVHVPAAPAPLPPAPAPDPPEPPPPHSRGDLVARGPVPDGYLRLRDQVVRFGVDALPSPPSVLPSGSADAPTRARELPEGEPWFGGWRPTFFPFRPGDRS